MYFVKIDNGIAVLLFRSDVPQTDENYIEISEQQFNDCTIPCRAEVTEDGVVFGDAVDFDEIPASEICEPEPEREPEPSQLDILEAQVIYTAMMTDTLLEV